MSVLGDRLATLEQNTTVKCKKSADTRKIITSKRKMVVDSGSVARAGGASASQGQTPPVGLNPPQATVPMSGPNHTVPPPSVLRQETRIQQEVQQRLQDLAKNVHSGNGRVKSQRGGPVDIFVSHRIKWPMSTFFMDRTMTKSCITNCPLCNGWVLQSNALETKSSY